jgi:hypothetical protein
MESATRNVDVPPPMIDLAKRRTEALFRHMQFGDTPMRMILASAYMQGMTDMIQTFDECPRARQAISSDHSTEPK